MVNPGSSWTGRWAADALRKHPNVTTVDVAGPQLLRVTRRAQRRFVVGTLGSRRVTADEVIELLALDSEIEFVANIPREAFWTGGAIDLVKAKDVGWGAQSDLLAAVLDDDPRKHLNKDMAFVERGLRQHDRVSHFDRIHDRLYSLQRDGRPPLTAVMLDDYVLTADHVRIARDRYGHFDVVVHTNPNGSITEQAEQVASSLGAEALLWADFYGRLNRR